MNNKEVFILYCALFSFQHINPVLGDSPNSCEFLDFMYLKDGKRWGHGAYNLNFVIVNKTKYDLNHEFWEFCQK